MYEKNCYRLEGVGRVLLAVRDIGTSAALRQKIRKCRGDKPLYSALVPNIFGGHRHFLMYSEMLPNLTGYPHDTNGLLA
jgi:hypothetical protein